MKPASKAKQAALLAAVAVTLVALPELAHAQGVGGGGGAGIIDSIVQWFMQNVAKGLVMLGIVAIAVLLFMQRFSAGVIASVVGGGLILANADAIAGFFGF